MVVKSTTILFYLFYLCSTFELPPFINKCELNSPKELEDCVLGQVPEVLSHFKTGYSPFNISPLDPLVIPSLDMALSEDFLIKMKDLQIEGLTTAVVNKFLPEFEENNTAIASINISLMVPNLQLRGVYSLEGFFFIMAVKGKGFTEMEIHDLSMDLKVNVSIDVRNDVEYYQIPRNFDVDLNFTDLHTHFENLVPNKELNDKLNEFMNERGLLMFELIKPGIVKTIRTIGHEFIIKLLMHVPVEHFFKAIKN
nr:uncharacterized protein LOC111422496 [Onthophagus taurus]